MDKKEFAVAIMPYLKPWTVADDTESWVVEMRHPDYPGAVLYLQNLQNRVHIAGGYPPEFYLSSEERVAITVNPSRDLARVAQDIQRRFIKPYLVRFLEAQEHVYRWALAIAKAQAVAEELAALGGTTVHHNRDEFNVTVRYARLTVYAGSDGPYVQLERTCSLPVEVALQVVKVLGG